MVDVSPQRLGELQRVVLELLWDRPEGLPVQQVLEELPGLIRLTTDEVGHFPDSFSPRYYKMVRLAAIPLIKAGWIIRKQKGFWAITDQGRQACLTFKTAHEFFQVSARLYEAWRSSKPLLKMVRDEAEEAAWEQIEQYLRELPQATFANLVHDLVVALGFHTVWSAPSDTNRGTIDLVLHRSALGVGESRTLVQIIHKGQPTTFEGVNSFASALGKQGYGVLVSSGGFTREARQTVFQPEFAHIKLIDLPTFVDLWIDHYEKLTQDAQQRFLISPVYFLGIAE